MERFNEAQHRFTVSMIFSACATGKQQQHMFKFGSTALTYNRNTLITERIATSDERTFVMMPVTANYFPALTIIWFVSVLLCAQPWLYNKDRFTRFVWSQVSAESSKERLLLSSRWWGAIRPRCPVSRDSDSTAGGTGGFHPGSTWTWHEKMRSVLKDDILPLGLLRKHQFLLLLGLVLAHLQNSYQNYHEAAVGGKTAGDPPAQIIKTGFNKSRNPSTVVKAACLMSQLAPMFECMQGRSFGANMWRVWIIFTRRVL